MIKLIQKRLASYESQNQLEEEHATKECTTPVSWDDFSNDVRVRDVAQPAPGIKHDQHADQYPGQQHRVFVANGIDEEGQQSPTDDTQINREQ